MSIVFIPETFIGTDKKTNEKREYFVIKIGLQKDGHIVRKSQPLLWLTKEQYEDYTSKN